MKKLDLIYLCETMGNICGFPVRLYEGNELVCIVDHSGLKYDPMLPFREDLFTLDDHIGTYITPRYYFYGVVRSGDTRLILGPTRQLPTTEQHLRELAFLSNVPAEDTQEFIQAMHSLAPMPLENLQLILCTLNYVINGEKLSLEDIVLNEPSEKQIASTPAKANDEQTIYVESHNTLAIEQALKETPQLFPETAIVACQGVEGAYSGIACEKLFKLHSAVYREVDIFESDNRVGIRQFIEFSADFAVEVDM